MAAGVTEVIVEKDQDDNEEIYENCDLIRTSLFLNNNLSSNHLPEGEEEEEDDLTEDLDLIELSSTSGLEDPSSSNLVSQLQLPVKPPLPPPRHV